MGVPISRKARPQGRAFGLSRSRQSSPSWCSGQSSSGVIPSVCARIVSIRRDLTVPRATPATVVGAKSCARAIAEKLVRLILRPVLMKAARSGGLT